MTTLRQRIEALTTDAEALDGIVHDGASRVASRVNNEGMAEQIRFLQEDVGCSEDEIIDAIKDSL